MALPIAEEPASSPGENWLKAFLVLLIAILLIHTFIFIVFFVLTYLTG